MNNADNLFDSSLPENSFEVLFGSDSYLQQNPTEQSLSQDYYQYQNPYEASFETESYQHQNPYEQPLNDYSYLQQNPYEQSLGKESYSQQSPNTSYNAYHNFTQSLTDAGIADKFSESISNDGLLDRQEMISLMQEAKDGGEIDANELTDLRNIVGEHNLQMSEDVRILSNKIVNGDPANINSKIGNLSEGSNAEQMSQLIDKWFLGKDKPELEGNTFTYQNVNGSLFQDDISINDVKQGKLGNCYLHAALAAVAEKSPQTIQEMIKDNGDGTYTVRFFIKENENLIPDYVTVNSELPTDENGKYVYASWKDNNNNNELWVSLVEKAYAQMNESGRLGQENAINSYKEIEGGFSGEAIEHITGKPSERFDLNSPTNDKTNHIISELASGKIVTIESKDLPENENIVKVGEFNLYESHAYVIKGYNRETDKFLIHNPHGENHLQLTKDEINKYFSRFWTS